MISVIIPVYNGANYLREAVESALAQTHPDVEVIVVDDGSNDGGATRDVTLSFGSRIRYIRKQNGGVASALNAGIREMRGNLFSWLSHDDVFYPEKLARQADHLRSLNDDNAISFCNYHEIDSASSVVGTGSIETSARDNSILSVFSTCVNGCSMLIPRSAFEATGLFNESLRNSQDNELWLRMVMQGYRLRYLPDVLLKSRRHPEQGSLTDSVRHAEEARAFYRWALGFIGAPERARNAADLFRVLLTKRQPSLAAALFAMLLRDRSPVFAVSAAARGIRGVWKGAIARRLTRVPGVAPLLKVVRKRRFGSSAGYWERRYQQGETSGVGSYGRYAEYKAGVLNRFVAAHRIRRVAEFGCGDGNQLRDFRFPEYLGLDVSRAALDRCRRLYDGDATRRFLVIGDPDTVPAIRQFAPELTLSLDVVYHLVEDAVFAEHIARLFDLSSCYVIIYSTNFDRRYDFCHQVDRRFSDYIAENVRGWRLLEVLANPHKGVDTQSEFHIYEKIDGPLVPVAGSARKA